MKINLKSRSRSAYALIIVLIMSVVAIIILGGTLKRTYGVALMNNRATDMVSAQNAAEAAIEMVFARMQYDFQSAGGLSTVSNHISIYQGLHPLASQDAYWGNYKFYDGKGNVDTTYVSKILTYTGPLPTAYSNRSTL